MSAIEVRDLTKRFGAVTAVDDLTFTVRPGSVTGFLGPNGAGKTTTLRVLLGLVAPTAGTATIGGRRYAEIEDPLQQVGAVLEASSFHPGRTARNHLRVICAAAGLPAARADAALRQVGLEPAAGRRVGGFSLGMRQRLGLAAALLGEPGVLILDEPANGLDPEGMHWLRGFLRHLADGGRTVLVSSHVLAEVAQTVDEVVIIASGRLVTQSTLAELADRSAGGVRVRSPQPDRLAAALAGAGMPSQDRQADLLLVPAATPAAVGELAAREGIVLHELRESASLEEIFLQLTGTPVDSQQVPA
jgi:ABC-2 type transport system ATP-binding protein